jgi:hypothetical protein
MAQKRLGLMAAILKFKMAADRGRFLCGTCPEMNQYPKKYLCTKFCAFIPICMIRGWTNTYASKRAESGNVSFTKALAISVISF